MLTRIDVCEKSKHKYNNIFINVCDKYKHEYNNIFETNWIKTSTKSFD